MDPGSGQENEIRICLEHVLASSSFAASKRRADLLRYLTERTLAGEGESLTEYAIALDVFGKPASFDPQRESTIRAEMSRLRRSLAEYYENDANGDAWRLQFPARGYALTVSPLVPEPLVPEPLASTPAVPPPVQPRIRHRTLWWAIAISSLLVSLGVLGAVFQARWRAAGLHAVIVLPFANLTGDTASDYIADGLTEDLTDSLAHIADLRVVARTSAFQFRGKAADIRDIGRRVDADVVVEGSVQRINGRLRITVQVNRAADGYHILSNRFDGAPSELARIERDMALRVLATLRPNASAPASHKPNPAAFDLFLKARSYRNQATREALDKTIVLLNSAIQLDPEYAEAYATLAGAEVTGITNFGGSSADAVAKAKAAAARAIELDPVSATAYAAEGYADAMLQLDWKDGEEELRSAARLMPQNARTHNWLGQTLLTQGKFPEALAELKMAERLDPLAAAPAATVGLGYFMARQYDNAIQQFTMVARKYPALMIMHILLGETWLAKNDYAKALTEFEALRPVFPGEADIGTACVDALSGKTAEARKIVARLEPTNPDPISMAVVFGLLGDRDQAFHWIDRAYEKRMIWMLKVHPLLDPLRADPRYPLWLKRAGFLQ
jgi:serine/threonine-protein kinase